MDIGLTEQQRRYIELNVKHFIDKEMAHHLGVPVNRVTRYRVHRLNVRRDTGLGICKKITQRNIDDIKEELNALEKTYKRFPSFNESAVHRIDHLRKVLLRIDSKKIN